MLGASHDHVPTSMITNDCERVRINSQVLDMISISIYRPPWERNTLDLSFTTR